MLGIRCPDRHALPRITSSKNAPIQTRAPSRASGFVRRPFAVARAAAGDAKRPYGNRWPSMQFTRIF
jgi:hypothetical protein